MTTSKCSCIKGQYDFFINEVTCDKILYQDNSLWMSGDNYEIPTVYEIEVLDFDKETKDAKLLKKTEVNGLGMTDISKSFSIKDGIYQFKISSCQNTYFKTVAILPKLQCCLDRYLASEDYDQFKHKEAARLLEAVRVTASFDQTSKSIDFYKMAKKKIDSLKCDC